MDSQTVADILRIAKDIETWGFPQLEDEKKHPPILGKLFYGATPWDGSVCDLAAARLGMASVDLCWTDANSSDSETLLNELRMNSEAVDVLATTFSSHETFGDGRRLTTKFPDVSTVPVINLHDDFYDWQSSLSHLLGFQERLGDLRKKQIVISWAFGSSFSSPAVVHGLMISAALLGANVRVAAPSEFSPLNRVMKKTQEIAQETRSAFESTSSFTEAFGDADAVFALNWYRLDDFNHPERNVQYASEYKNWYATREIIPERCVFSTEPPLQTEIAISPELADDPENITVSWFSRRVKALAASIVHVLQTTNGGKTKSIV